MLRFLSELIIRFTITSVTSLSRYVLTVLTNLILSVNWSVLWTTRLAQKECQCTSTDVTMRACFIPIMCTTSQAEIRHVIQRTSYLFALFFNHNCVMCYWSGSLITFLYFRLCLLQWVSPISFSHARTTTSATMISDIFSETSLLRNV